RGNLLKARALLEQAGWQAAPEGAVTARARHLRALESARANLVAAVEQARLQTLELMAEELRLAHHALGEITGAYSSEDLLGSIFAGFCIGK
ncbi:MAG: tRNA uridine-5-carboxymethylaminomethyl(34) synthesis GTPase MnmE, partial [Burkholderiales bacterium]|nr:tRNA uridine-5-carboxymethylaminomethyl(34) synthesis GTPase MnmE [Burkholderiales bacterium]